jgi:gluconokinase
VFLNGSAELIAERLRARRGHFAPESLLASQLATLERPEDALEVDVSAPPPEVVRTILAELRNRAAGLADAPR